MVMSEKKSSNFKGNLGRVQEMVDKLRIDAGEYWQKAERCRTMAVDTLGNINHAAVHETMVLSAQSIAFNRAADRLSDLLSNKKGGD